MERFIICTRLAKMENDKPVLINGEPVYEENYFCGFQPVPNPNFKNVQLIEWDTDVNFAQTFASHYAAKQMVKRIETGDHFEIKKKH